MTDRRAASCGSTPDDCDDRVETAPACFANDVAKKSGEICQLFSLAFDLSWHLWAIQAEQMQTEVAEGAAETAIQLTRHKVEGEASENDIHKNVTLTWRQLKEMIRSRGPPDAFASVAEMREASNILHQTPEPRQARQADPDPAAAATSEVDSDDDFPCPLASFFQDPQKGGIQVYSPHGSVRSTSHVLMLAV